MVSVEKTQYFLSVWIIYQLILSFSLHENICQVDFLGPELSISDASVCIYFYCLVSGEPLPVRYSTEDVHTVLYSTRSVVTTIP